MKGPGTCRGFLGTQGAQQLPVPQEGTIWAILSRWCTGSMWAMPSPAQRHSPAAWCRACNRQLSSPQATAPERSLASPRGLQPAAEPVSAGGTETGATSARRAGNTPGCSDQAQLRAELCSASAAGGRSTPQLQLQRCGTDRGSLHPVQGWIPSSAQEARAWGAGKSCQVCALLAQLGNVQLPVAAVF